MRIERLFVMLVVLIAVLGSPAAHAAERRSLRVGTKEAPPFVVRGPDGTLDGPSIRLWRELAEDLGVAYTIEERELGGLLDGVRDGSLDVAIAAITVTSERETTMDFSHPFHTAGLAMATRRRERSLWLALADTVLSSDLLRLVAGIALLQLVVGASLWLVERHSNREQFPKDPRAGLWSGYWWAVVTMTTVGYGDKAPRTAAGRTIALMWMLCSVVMISTFTAVVTSRLTLRELETELHGPGDLDRVRVGVIVDSSSERWARASGLDFRRFADLDAALDGVAAEEIDVVVHDAPLLEQGVQARPADDVQVLPARFQRQDYAIALPEGSPLREQINRLLPEKVRGNPLGDPSIGP